ncbi:MAG: hypothetical protein J3K34DRAFT_427497 [Monoraphidium minutum]|nr:MAG: hypothetical protein J3K34DRAFT_427497 [Monoraphidium minutum]
MCLDLAENALGPEPRAVLAAMLDYSRAHEVSLQDEASVQMTEGDITQALRTLVEEGRVDAYPTAPLEQLLASLEACNLEAVERVGAAGISVAWRVQMGCILQRGRYYQAVAAVKEKFGSQGVRVLQLLLQKRHLEQKQVAELTMGPQKETRELLYRMMRAGFVDMQLVPRGADRAPSRSFFTWTVNLPAAFKRIAADTYKAGCNVWSRYAHTMERNADLVAASRAAFYGGGSINVTDDARPRMAKLHLVNQALVAAQLRLDEQAALFSDFAPPTA